MGAKFIDRSGQVYGRWTVASYSHSNDIGRVWLCRCECGVERPVLWASLKSGVSKSCGCAKEIFVRTHGLSKTKPYRVWKSMIERCENPNSNVYKDYGGRGITVCPAWRNAYAEFLKDMGARPSAKHSIDRKDNNGNYEPGNCHWGTQVEQGRNRRTNHNLTFRGATKPMSEWAESIGINYSTLRNRINVYGWSIEDALTTLPR